MISFSDTQYLFVLIGMVAVTFIPRIIPQLSWNPEKISPRVQFMLALVPFGILAALLVPGVFTGMAGSPLVATLAAVAVATALAWRGVNIVFIVLAAVLVHYLVSTLV